MTGSGESTGTSSRNASALPSTVSQPSAARRSSVCAGSVAALHDVAEADDLVDAEPLDVVEHGAEGDVVPVLVGEEREAHGQSLDRTPARPLRTHSGRPVKSP